jgi:hypothetical protein
VHRIVPPRSVTARDLEGELLAIEVVASEVKTGDANEYDSAALAAHGRGGTRGLVIIRS